MSAKLFFEGIAHLAAFSSRACCERPPKVQLHFERQSDYYCFLREVKQDIAAREHLNLITESVLCGVHEFKFQFYGVSVVGTYADPRGSYRLREFG